MLSAIWSARWYGLLGVISFVMFMVVNTPLHFLWSYVEKDISRLPVAIEQPQGTLWSGQVLVSTGNIQPVTVQWQLSPLGLLTGKVSLEFEADSQQIRLDGRAIGSINVASGTATQLEIEALSGYVDSLVLKPFLKSQRVSADGSLDLNNVNARVALVERQITELSGQINYSGGTLDFVVDRQRVNAEVPAILGQLALQQQIAALTLTSTDDAEIARVFLQPDGWGGLAVRRRGLDMLGRTWADKSATPDTVVFEVSQKIL